MSQKKSRIPTARCRIWVAQGREILFGDGRVRILEAVRRHGSMNKAAAALNMSYRAVWGKIRKSEELLGIKLLEPASVQGHRGSRLSKAGNALLNAYNEFKSESVLAVDSCFERTIGRLPEIRNLRRRRQSQRRLGR